MNAQDRIEWPIRPAPDPLSDETTCLLQGPLAEAWPERAAQAGLRERLARRAAASAQRIGSMVNVPRDGRMLLEQAEGLTVHRLYQAACTAPARPGEPVRVCWAELAPGARWQLAEAGPGLARDWLLVTGGASVQAEGEPALALQPLDYLVQGRSASQTAACIQAGEEGAALLLRERPWPAGQASEASVLSRDAPGQWQDYAPLIRRRVLWQHGPMAAMLWLAAPGAVVPQHRHGHDEECLMLRGDLFQDDFLLREGDYQLAPSGSGHETVNTDTGALIYAHGDLDMLLTG